MHQKLFAVMFLLTFSLLLLDSTNALIVYLRPPKMIIRLNTSDTVERSLTIENRNNISMGINATVSGNITEVVEITNPTFEIPANETKTIDFITKADNPGVYSGQILVTFTANMTRPVDIPSDITIIATGKPVQNFDITTVLIIILVIIVVVVLFLKKRGNKK